MKDFSTALVRWYGLNKRDLPWRNTRNPYHIWLSEVILQQTRVDQGMAYYLKFVDLFPTVQHLADASEDLVLKTWQGLGYYSRARNLHAAAKSIVCDYHGVFPDTYEELLKLKGVGSYTAAAVASFCFNRPLPVVDGNVIRVLSRVFGVEEVVDSSAGKKLIQSLAEEVIDPANPAEHNQAMMEFGALWCTPAQPKCGECVFAQRCEARAKGLTKVLPRKKSKTAVKDIWMYYLVAEHNSSLLIKKRENKDIWKGLHDFPEINSEIELDPVDVLDRFSKIMGTPLQSAQLRWSQEFVHLLSHRKIRAKFIELKLEKAPRTQEQNLFSVAREKLEDYGVPKLIERYLDSSVS